MLKIQYSSIKGIAKVISKNKFYHILRLKDGSIAKVFTQAFLRLDRKNNCQTERKIIESENIHIPGIATPTGIIYKKGEFCGYTMNEGLGEISHEKSDSLPQLGLKQSALIIKKLEEIIEEAHKQGLVFPNILETIEQILNKKIDFFSIEEMQYKDMPAPFCSTYLGDLTFLTDTKYMQTDNNLFTPEIDRLSMLILYLIFTCNIDLMKKVNEYNKNWDIRETITEIILELGLESSPLAMKLYNLFRDSEANQPIGEDLMKIAEKYQLVRFRDNKKFIRKR